MLQWLARHGTGNTRAALVMMQGDRVLATDMKAHRCTAQKP